jgi:tetratricopeptide (TPR) repeat protein
MINIAELLYTASELYTNKAFPEAKKIYLDLLKTDPDNIEILTGLSCCIFYGEGFDYDTEYEQAWVYYRKAINLSNRNPLLLIKYANLLNNSGSMRYFKEAVSIFDEVLLKLPGNYEAISGKAYSYYLLSKFEDCVLTCKEAQSINPTDSRIWFYQAWAYMMLSNYKDGLQSFNMAVKYNPLDHIAWCYRSLACFELNLFEEAIFSADEALKIDPNYSTAKLYKIDALRALGRNEEANAIKIPYEPIDNM